MSYGNIINEMYCSEVFNKVFLKKRKRIEFLKNFSLMPYLFVKLLWRELTVCSLVSVVLRHGQMWRQQLNFRVRQQVFIDKLVYFEPWLRVLCYKINLFNLDFKVDVNSLPE